MMIISLQKIERKMRRVGYRILLVHGYYYFITYPQGKLAGFG
jgi:hypothetical protein